MARASGLSVSTVQRIWRAFGLQPHRLETFKLSSDPDFVAKVRDVVGLYVSPPERAIVLCVDEKSQIQALDRSQPLLPMRPGQPARRTHDYKRHGTTSLFAALDVVTGKVIGKCFSRHRAAEFRKFLDVIEASVPKTLDVHLVMGYGRYSQDPLDLQLAGQAAPMACAPDAHQRILAQSGRAVLRRPDRQKDQARCSSKRRPELTADIEIFIATHNAEPKPFRWTKSADDILASIERFCVYNASAT